MTGTIEKSTVGWITTEARTTDWMPCVNGPWYPSLSSGGYDAYRVWQQFDGLRWFQRHEWKAVDGSIEAEEWIASGTKFWLSKENDHEQIDRRINPSRAFVG